MLSFIDIILYYLSMNKIEIQKHLKDLKTAKALIENAYQALKNEVVFREFKVDHTGQLLAKIRFEETMFTLGKLIEGAQEALKEAK